MKILPHVNKYTVARAAVITRRTGRRIIREAERVQIEHNSAADKLMSVVMFASSFAPKFNARVDEYLALQKNIAPVVRTAVRKKSTKLKHSKTKVLPTPYLPKTPDKVKIMAKGQPANVPELNMKFNDLLLDNEKNKNPLNNKAPVFIRSAKKHGVNPEVLMAIAMHESARGTSDAAKSKHNIGGIMNAKYKLKIFSNVNLCIDQMAETLAIHHRESKINTIKELAYAGKYCSKDEASEWVKGVMYYLNELQS